MMSHVLLTGATGLLGRYLVRDLVSLGVPVAALARPSEKQSGTERVAEAMAPLDAPMPKVLEGDIAEPGLGLSAEDRAWVAANCDRVLHSAASLVFHCADQGRDPWRSNYFGTQHVAALAREAGIRSFHHVSTAYVCGTRAGIIREDERNVGQAFRNDYEECKCAAESWLAAEGGFESLTVYRPAVIVGDSLTGYTSTYHGPYRTFQFASLVVQQIDPDDDGKRHIPIRFAMDGAERHNLVPVDWVSAVIARGVADPAKWGTTYHLAPPKPTTYGEIVNALLDYFNVVGVTLVGERGLPADQMTELETAFTDYIHTHSEYLGNEPLFDTTHTRTAFPDLPCPAVDGPMLTKLVEFAVNDQFGKRRRR
ncbi:MAG: SDR family oxidoreductase [Gemmataceae bacterium]